MRFRKMKTALLIQLGLSLLRHFVPWATAYLAGAGVSLTTGTSPVYTVALAVAFYVVAQGWSLLRKWWATHK